MAINSKSYQSFSPLDHKIIVGGVSVSGLSDGTYLTIKPNANLATYIVGADGDVGVNLIANGTATATLKLNYANPNYKLLRALADVFQTTGTYLPFSSINVKDPLDSTISFNSHFDKHSDDTYSVDPGSMMRSYDIILHNAIRV